VLLIPAIDLKSGRCVRLYQGLFAKETVYDLTPHALLRRYENLGARWVHLVDLDGARDGMRLNHAVIAALAAESSLKLQVGGGVRDVPAIELLLDAGVSRVVVGSAAVHRPPEVLGWFKRFGAERLCLAFDVRRGPEDEPCVHTHGWTQSENLTLWNALAPYSDEVRHVLCTDIDRDGTLTGPNLNHYRSCIERFPTLAWEASGGIRDAADLKALAAIGITAAISGKALLEERIHPEELQPFWLDASFRASTSATVRS
jgi:phosphoribosylformimino-5-aminoimidazole carboxamide ribotide isomerase